MHKNFFPLKPYYDDSGADALELKLLRLIRLRIINMECMVCQRMGCLFQKLFV